MANKSLISAKRARKDEFYTQLNAINNELKHYKEHFKGKVVLCNCDDPRVSEFFNYFVLNFNHLGLKKLITTCYKNQEPDLFSRHDSDRAVYLEYNGSLSGKDNVPTAKDIGIKHLKGDGDFRSAECIELLKQADIVVTNPPFSLFREYVAQLIEYNKKFVIIGNQNAYTYKEIFKLIKENKIWVGYNYGAMKFEVPKYDTKGYEENGKKWRKFGNICWFTNLDIKKRHEDLICYRNYTPEKYPKYDNYDAINVDEVADIPCDYKGLMGVPITFLNKYNPKQFELLGIDRYMEDNPNYGHRFTLNGEEIYARLVVRLLKTRDVNVVYPCGDEG